jgi:D-psicose/D-tagatose/L-ribulose 3-epimerase
MKVGFNMLLWTTHVTDDDLPLLKSIKEAGYDGVEIPIFAGDPEHFEKVGKAIKDNGLGCTLPIAKGRSSTSSGQSTARRRWVRMFYAGHFISR